MKEKLNQPAPILSLKEDIRAEFQEYCETRLLLPCIPEAAHLIEASKRITPILAKDKEVTSAMQAVGNGEKNYVVLDNIAVDNQLCKPPVDGMRPADKSSWTSEMSLLCLLHLAGLIPLSYWEEKGNDLIHQVSPSANKENTRSNAGKVELGMHSDNSILEEAYRPEFLALLSLINEPGTATEIASVRTAYAQLSSKHQYLLKTPSFRVQTPDSFDKAFRNKKISSEYRPIIKTNSSDGLYAAGNLYAVECKDNSSRLALSAFDEALNDVKEKIVLKKGMALIFNNGLVFHSRGAIAQGDRWLQRVFGKKDLVEIRKATSSTIKDYIFSVKGLIL